MRYWFFSSLCFLSTLTGSVSATDLNDDGLSDVIVYDAGASKVLALNTDLQVLAETTIDPAKVNGDPILLPAQHGSEFVVLSLRFRKKEGVLFAFKNNQQIGEHQLGKFRNGSVFAYNFNNNNITDLLIVNGKEIAVLFDAFSSSAFEQRLPINVGKKGLAYPFWSEGNAFLAVSNSATRKKRKRKARSSTTVFGLSSLRSEAMTLRSVKLSQTPIPVVAADGSIITVKSPKKYGAKKKFELINLLTGERRPFATEVNSELIPGKFLPSGSSSQILLTQSGLGKIYDFADSNGQSIFSIDLFPGSNDFPEDQDDDDDILPPGPGENCIDQYPNEVIAQIEQAYAINDFATLTALTNALAETNFCQDIMLAIIQYLTNLFSSRALEVAQYGPQTQFVGAPFYSTRDPNRLPAGCDTLQDGRDGPSGFLFKPISDTTGNAVVLTPQFVSKATINDCRSGKVLTKLQNHGPSNGRAATLRAPRPGPTYGSCAIVKATTNSFFGGGGTNICWKVNPSIRND
ncbi:MAG: hypothetical protein KDD64_15290 [Bdellovibrionales bacterium]|nr:hypothetical protein [Bdellovibrionales bacterium]